MFLVLVYKQSYFHNCNRKAMTESVSKGVKDRTKSLPDILLRRNVREAFIDL